MILCKSKKHKNLHESIYETLSDYYNYLESDTIYDTDEYIKCILKTRQYLEKQILKLNSVELEMLNLIDKMFISIDKKVDSSFNKDDEWSKLKEIAKKNIQQNSLKEATNSIQDMSKFELLFDSISLNSKLEQAKNSKH